MWDSGARLCRAVGVVYAAAVALTVTSSAQAFDLKHTQAGLDVRWAVPHVAFVVDPRLNEAVPLNAPEKRGALGGPLPAAIGSPAGESAPVVLSIANTDTLLESWLATYK